MTNHEDRRLKAQQNGKAVSAKEPKVPVITGFVIRHFFPFP
jgi:hypothetical protein